MLSSGDNPISGTLAATTVAASLGSQACSSVRVQADPGNATNVLICEWHPLLPRSCHEA